MNRSQPFDLTDLDWSPELWIACHDDDEQNARLARHAWDDNGLDVPENYMGELTRYLGKPDTVIATLGCSLTPSKIIKMFMFDPAWQLQWVKA